MSSWFSAVRAAKRRKAMEAPAPAAWDEILDRNFPMTARLEQADRERLKKRIQGFLAEKRFEGLGGLELTDEIRVTIAAQACLLQLHRSEDCYPKLKSILVYPSAYKAPSQTMSPDGVITEGPQTRLGEAWTLGTVVLSWDDVRHGAADCKDGHNVVLHEFAHQLDMEDSAADGAPILPRRSSYVAWARVLGTEYESLQEEIRRRHRTVMDRYGATNPAEFFAVATETFFEKPRQLKKKHPELYEQLREFYGQDPEIWAAANC
jgi:Mlc titration factor MtfA (ptsG expression regulator)